MKSILRTWLFPASLNAHLKPLCYSSIVSPIILNNIPVIDIAPSFLDSQGKQTVSDSIRVACEDVVFYTIIGHGVSSDEINLTRQASISFFVLDLEDKLNISQPSEKISWVNNIVGERALAYSQGNQTPPDLQESFAMETNWHTSKIP